MLCRADSRWVELRSVTVTCLQSLFRRLAVAAEQFILSSGFESEVLGGIVVDHLEMVGLDCFVATKE